MSIFLALFNLYFQYYNMIIYTKKQFSIFHPHNEDLEYNFHQFII